MCKRGSDLFVKRVYYEALLPKLGSDPERITQILSEPDSKGNTLLISFIRKGYYDLANDLISKGVTNEVKVKDEYGDEESALSVLMGRKSNLMEQNTTNVSRHHINEVDKLIARLNGNVGNVAPSANGGAGGAGGAGIAPSVAYASANAIRMHENALARMSPNQKELLERLKQQENQDANLPEVEKIENKIGKLVGIKI